MTPGARQPGEGWWPGRSPDLDRARRVELIAALDPDVVADRSTWKVNGEPLTPSQWRDLADATEDDWHDAAQLTAIEVEVLRRWMEHAAQGVERWRPKP